MMLNNPWCLCQQPVVLPQHPAHHHLHPCLQPIAADLRYCSSCEACFQRK
jgi:hypothetical protein